MTADTLGREDQSRGDTKVAHTQELAHVRTAAELRLQTPCRRRWLSGRQTCRQAATRPSCLSMEPVRHAAVPGSACVTLRLLRPAGMQHHQLQHRRAQRLCADKWPDAKLAPSFQPVMNAYLAALSQVMDRWARPQQAPRLCLASAPGLSVLRMGRLVSLIAVSLGLPEDYFAPHMEVLRSVQQLGEMADGLRRTRIRHDAPCMGRTLSGRWWPSSTRQSPLTCSRASWGAEPTPTGPLVMPTTHSLSLLRSAALPLLEPTEQRCFPGTLLVGDGSPGLQIKYRGEAHAAGWLWLPAAGVKIRCCTCRRLGGCAHASQQVCVQHSRCVIWGHPAAARPCQQQQ